MNGLTKMSPVTINLNKTIEIITKIIISYRGVHEYPSIIRLNDIVNYTNKKKKRNIQSAFQRMSLMPLCINQKSERKQQQKSTRKAYQPT